MSQNNYNMGIIEVLLRSENHIRGLARLLGTNQTTIARKVQELYKENIIDWKQEGKNKVVFLKKSLDSESKGNSRKNIIPAKQTAIDTYIKITEKRRGTLCLTNHCVPGSMADAITIDISNTNTKSFKTKSRTKNNTTSTDLTIVPRLILIFCSLYSISQ